MRKKYTPKYKADAALEVIKEQETLNQIASRLEVHPNMLGRWRNEAVQNLHIVFEDRKGEQKRAHEAQVQQLYSQIGELSTKLAWLKKKSGIDV